MAYLLVMGALALSVCFTLGWGLVRGTRWLVGRLPNAGRKPPRRAARRPPARSRVAPKPRARKPEASKAPSEPWRLTRWLAQRRSPLPLGLLALLLYGGSRLAEYGMAFRPQVVPGEFHGLVSSLGWVAAALLALGCVNLLAIWRCR